MKNLDNTLSKSLINISYLGVSNDNITGQLIQIADSYLQSFDGLNGLSRRVPFLIAESFQNIIRHSNLTEQESTTNFRKDFFQIDFLPDRVILWAVNWIKRENVAQLDKKIDDINELSQEELKSLFKNVLTRGEISSKGGAGLGIIEMARKSRMPIKKKFVDFDDEMSTFFLGLEIVKQRDSKNSNFDISRIEKQYYSFVKNGILLQYNGHFSKEINFPLIEILERNLIDPDKMNSSAAENMTMIIEIIQNASKHGMLLNDVREGAFSIRSLEKQLVMKCDNYINSDDYDDFNQYLKRIRSMNEIELKFERNRIMLEEALSGLGDGGLGLLELAIFSQNTFDYSFSKMPNNSYLYSIEVKLKNNE